MSLPGPLSLRVSVTDRCRFRCLYCTPAAGVQRFEHDQILRYEEIHRFVALLAEAPGLAKVHLTGGEPLDRRDIARLVALLAQLPIRDLAMTTNAQRLAQLAQPLRAAGLHRVNISLNSLRPDTFSRITCGGELGATLEGIEAARKAGLALKFNATVIGGINDKEVCDLARFALDRGGAVRFIELMPLGPGADDYRRRFVPAADTLDALGRDFDLKALPREPGTSSRLFRAADAAGRAGVIGLISPCSDPFCGDCNRLRLTADGRLVGCLAKEARVSIRPLLRETPAGWEGRVRELAGEVMAAKRSGEEISGNRCMAKLGG